MASGCSLKRSLTTCCKELIAEHVDNAPMLAAIRDVLALRVLGIVPHLFIPSPVRCSLVVEFGVVLLQHMPQAVEIVRVLLARVHLTVALNGQRCRGSGL